MGACMATDPHGVTAGGSPDEPTMAQQTAPLTLEECLDRLAGAVAAVSTRGLRRDVAVTRSGVGEPGWRRLRNEWSWVAPIVVTISVGAAAESVELLWPARWTRTDALACPVAFDEGAVIPGWHDGFYLGKPLATGYGVRLREGIHLISRPVKLIAPADPATSRPAEYRWKSDVVVSPILGGEVFGRLVAPALNGKEPGVYLDEALETRIRDELTAEAIALTFSGQRPPAAVGAVMSAYAGVDDTTTDGERVRFWRDRPDDKQSRRRFRSAWRKYKDADEAGSPDAPQSRSAMVPPTVEDIGLHAAQLRAAEIAEGAPPPSRTAAERNRLVGADEVMAELVFSRYVRRQIKAWRDDAKCASELAFSLGRAARTALTTLSQGKAGASSVVTDVDRGTTLARVEQSARTCFNGFRGLPATLRGRADLRDLDPGWRGILCPVQTPESTDVGLVRYTTVGLRSDAPVELRTWFDLSASAALIPFINHNDPARASIGSKNLKQAVPVVGAEAPRIATGWERVLARAEGVATAPVDGEVTAVELGAVTLETDEGPLRVGFGAPHLERSGPDNRWWPDVVEGDRVAAGQVLAHAPDVVLDPETGEPELALGVNALVALTPWYGLNFEDAIVVSESFAARMTSCHVVRVDEQIDLGDDVQHVALLAVGVGGQIEAGETLVTVGEWRTVGDRLVPPRAVTSPVGGEFLGSFVDPRRASVSSLIVTKRALAVGDKLSNRHQGKGVISAILPDDAMPRAEFPDGTTRPVEVVLNPLGVLRRLNIGQLWEMHASLLAELLGTGRQDVGRAVADPGRLSSDLEAAGARRGRLRLSGPDGKPVGGSGGVVVGWQYILKLDHLASGKLSVRGADATRSPVSGQPSQTGRYRRGERVGAAQRVGEMEVWALEAAGAETVLFDALTARAASRPEESDLPRAALRSAQAHLSVAGYDLVTSATDRRPRALRWVDRGEIHRLLPRSRPDSGRLKELPGWREAEKWPRIGKEPPGLPELMDLADYYGPEWAEGQAASWSLLHPLYRPRHKDGTLLHGDPGSLDAEEVRYMIPLPEPMPHPWGRSKRTKTGERKTTTGPVPEPITAVPVLPPAFRIAGASTLDRHYQDLAVALVRQARNLQRAETNEASAIEKEAAAGELETPGRDLSEAEQSELKTLRESAVKLGKTADWLRKAARDRWIDAQVHVEAIIGADIDIDGAEMTPDPDSMLGRLGGKRGLLRRFQLGQSVTHSGRSVIVPDVTLRPFEVGLPAPMAKAIGVDPGEPFGDVVLVNRQPSIQPYNMLCLQARVTDGDAVRLHPLVIGALAGDFDGDTVAVHRPVLADARAQAWEQLSPQANLRSSASRQLLAKLDLDIALGIHLLVRTAPGRRALATLTGLHAAAMARKPPRPAELAEAIVANAAEATQALVGLAELQRAAWQGVAGWSIGAVDLYSDGDGGDFAVAITAGVAGKESARDQLLVRRGAVEGGYPGTPLVDVADGFLTGLADDDYFATSPGALASLAEKKLTSPHAGALTKSLVEIADQVVIAGQDCGLPDHLRSPLTCRASDGVCAACYGPDPGIGTLLPPGRRVGVLAGLLIGARSSELSMKVFHGGGKTGDLSGGLATLKALFGDGQSRTAFPGSARNLTEYLDNGNELTDPAKRLEHLQPLVGRAVTTLGGKAGETPPVDGVHVAVVLRQLYETWLVRKELAATAPPGPRSLASLAQQRGRTPFEVATSRGSVRWLATADVGASGGFRTRLATGAVR